MKTRRPFQFDQGLTLTGGADGTKGKYSDGNDFAVNGLANWRNDKVGFMAAAAYSDNTLGDNYSGYGGGVFSENDWGAGKANNYIAPHGFEVYNRQIQRKRLGASAAFEAKLGEGFTPVSYTHLDVYKRQPDRPDTGSGRNRPGPGRWFAANNRGSVAGCAVG